MILDTNALSAFADEQRSLLEVLDSARELALPVVVLGEYRFGILVSRHASDYQRWLEELIGRCRVLDIDESTSRHYADIRNELKRSGTPIPVNDAWIAALARQYRLPIASRDRHFDSVRDIQRVPW